MSYVDRPGRLGAPPRRGILELLGGLGAGLFRRGAAGSTPLRARDVRRGSSPAASSSRGAAARPASTARASAAPRAAAPGLRGGRDGGDEPRAGGPMAVLREQLTPAAERRPLRAGLLPASNVLQRERHDPDFVALVSIIALAAIGILMVYSASAIDAYSLTANTFGTVGPQILWAALGLVTMLVLMRVDYRWLRVISVPLFVVALGLLVAVLIPGIGVVKNQSARWLDLGPLPDIHPAEFAKLALIVYLAHWLTTRGTSIRSFWRGTVPFAILTVPVLVLVAREPDLGTTSVLALTAFTLYFIAGARILHVLLGVVAGAAGGLVLMFAAGSYPLERIRALLDPMSDPSGAGYHTLRGLEALGVGGLFGIGLGNNRVAVPNDWNDFVFSVVAQELGLVGGVIVIGLFVAFGFAGIRTALRSPDTFGALLAAGITGWICFQAIINISVVLAVIPVTGITLPFVSAGGSSLIISFAAVGILLSISRETVERGSWNASADRGRGHGRAYLPGSRRRTIAPRSAGRT